MEEPQARTGRTPGLLRVPWIRAVIVGALLALAMLAASPAAGAAPPPLGGLTQLSPPSDCISQGGSVCGQTTGVGLDNPVDVAVSPDGKHLYAVSPTLNSVASFRRDETTGAVSQLAPPLDCLSEGGSLCGTTSGRGLLGANSLAVSPDGRHVYVTAGISDAIAILVRNPATGALRQQTAPNDCLSEGGSVCGVTTAKGLDFAKGIAISPDGKHVYVAASTSDAVAAFSRNATTGALTQLPAPSDCVSQGGAVCGTTSGTGLDDATDLAVSPDGKHLYVVSLLGNAVAAFSREESSGALTQLAPPNDCVSEGGSLCGTTTGKGLVFPQRVLLSPDGKHLYVSSSSRDAVAAFSRDGGSGALSQLPAPDDCLSEGGSVCGTTTGRGLDGASGLAISPDGDHLYVASPLANALAVLSRDATSGALRQFAPPDDCLSEGGSVCGRTSGKGLENVQALALSPDGANLYTVAALADALAAFARQLPPTCSDLSRSTGHNTATTIALACTDPNGDPLTYSVDSPPLNGSLGTINQQTGTVRYTPKSGFVGNDAFSFKASDDSEESNIAIATISVEAPAAPPIRCQGQPATIVGSEGPDVITGTPGDDVIVARGGDDVVRAAGGNDLVCLGSGNDRGLGGRGDDRIYGQAGDDRIRGKAGADLLFGNRGTDLLNGGAGADRLFGARGPDRLLGGAGDDRLFGHRGRDLLRAGRGNDLLNGGAGPDRLEGKSGDDTLVGGRRTDRLLGQLGNDLLRARDGTRDVVRGGEGFDRAEVDVGLDRISTVESLV